MNKNIILYALFLVLCVQPTKAYSVFDFGYSDLENANPTQLVYNIGVYSFLGILQYLLVSAIFEWKNPMPKNKLRMENIKREIKYGTTQIFLQVAYSMIFYHYVYPYCQWYRYYTINSYGLLNFGYGMVFLYIWTTVLGYWVHRIFHFRFLYKHVHSVHHSFREPTAFGYCATHPLEGISEVNTVLHLAELIIPIHPLMTLFFFEYITVNEMMGHDGGEYDHSDHYRHHLYYVVNYGDTIMDEFFGTVYNSKNYPIKAKCTYVESIEDRTEAIFMKYK
ncbi:unnamed protein product [Paramecium pentaurelia]|uniref:Fatty acid hydroxylase domain-containing protein n=1 Tax=Paramecium pentaurelia TaxID=43138 RepID=A0A8S1UUW2_9CILI|nr:unnamed protein product [Paramecium pentaurelia]